MTDDYVDADATRSLQTSGPAVAHCWQTMQRWGAYNLLKVVEREPAAPSEKPVRGYICLLPSILGQTPIQIGNNLGLRAGQLAKGANIYQLLRLPHPGEFAVRGYTTLVDGLRLAPGRKQDSGGYRPGWGSLQITLTAPVQAKLFASLAPGDRFRPPVHPKYRA